MGLIAASCTKKQSDETASSSHDSQVEDLIQRGRAVYMTACAACHNMDPRLDGALGPAVAGSSLELLHARVIEAKYPEGYKPKRETAQMVALPQFKNDLPAIHAYLNSLK